MGGMDSSTVTVCVVDDDRSVRVSLAALLESHGFTVRQFSSAEDLLDSFEEGAAACLLLDVHMPGMGGLELLQKLRNDYVRTPIIMITGHGDVPLAVQAMKAGAVDFLEKPCSEESLLDALRRALDSRDLSDEVDVPGAVVAQRLERLTPREREVLDHLVLGEINKVIAHKLNISQRTVEIHRARIKEKMEAQSLADLIRMMP